MKYIKSTMIFIKNNFLKLFCYAIAPALLVATLVNPVSIFNFILNLPNEDYSKFSEIFVALNNFKNWYFLLMLGLLLCSSIIISGELGVIHRKMLYGIESNFSIRKFFAKVNNYVIPIFLICIGLFAAIEFVLLFLSMFVFFWLRLKIVTTIIFCVISAIIFFCGLIFAFSLMTLVLPNMTIRGYSYFNAIRISAKTASKSIISIFVALALPLIIFIVPICLLNLIQFSGDYILKYVTNTIFFILVFIYYLVLCYVIFFDLEDIEREDLKDKKIGGYSNAN